MKPGPMFSQIKQGNIVVFNGEELNPGDFVGKWYEYNQRI